MPMPSEEGAGEDMAVKRASAFSMATRANGKNKLATFHGPCLVLFVSSGHYTQPFELRTTQQKQRYQEPNCNPSWHGYVKPVRGSIESTCNTSRHQYILLIARPKSAYREPYADRTGPTNCAVEMASTMKGVPNEGSRT